METNILDGTDLILSVGGNALAYSTGCKITTSAETGERVTKEASAGKWKEKYVKSFSESISADGLVCTSSSGNPSYDVLKSMMLTGKPVDGSYAVRGNDTTNNYTGKYVITSLDLDGQAGEDAKYSIQLENYGKVNITGNGLKASAASSSADHSEE